MLINSMIGMQQKNTPEREGERERERELGFHNASGDP